MDAVKIGRMNGPSQVSPDGLWYWTGSDWRSTLSADGTQRWNGTIWVPATPIRYSSPPDHVAPAAAQESLGTNTQVGGGRKRRLLAWSIVGVGILIGMGAIGVAASRFVESTLTAAATAATERDQERAYNAIYRKDALALHDDALPLIANGVSPGVCASTTTTQACYDTDQKVIPDLRTLLNDLGKVRVPSRFQAGDRDLKRGIQLDIDALTLRDQAIVGGTQNPPGDTGREGLLQAATALRQAFGEFPADNPPRPVL